MNAAQVIDHFDRISDAPDAILRLRRFILNLAVRGKLVEQDATEEPASELLERIQLKKHILVTSKTIRKSNKLDPLAEDEIAFNIPHGWLGTRLGSVYDVRDGTHDTPRYMENGYPLITSKNLYSGRLSFDDVKFISEQDHRKISERSRVDRGDILLAMIGSIGNPVIVDIDRPFSIKNVALFKYYDPFLSSPGFLCLFLQHAAAEMRILAAGGLQPFVSLGFLRNYPLTLPPLAEQHRIVAKVDELMALCDRLDAAKAERESRRNKLATASLHRLNNGADADEFREHARFHLRHLPRLTTRPEHIQQLRQTILNLAVRGKLVPQDPNDEPANELVSRIRFERARLISQGHIRQPKAPPQNNGFHVPSNLPNGWCWTQLGDLALTVTSGSRDWASHYSSDGAIFVRMGNLSRNSYQLRLDHIQRVAPPSNAEGERTKLEPGDILISITGEVGLLGLIPEGFGEAYINQHTCLVRLPVELQNRFIAEFCRSPLAQEQFNAPQRGLKNSFRLTDVATLLTPLPPLAEQRRIVAKVDELMALADALESQLATVRTTAAKLMEAAVAELTRSGVIYATVRDNFPSLSADQPNVLHRAESPGAA